MKKKIIAFLLIGLMMSPGKTYADSEYVKKPEEPVSLETRIQALVQKYGRDDIFSVSYYNPETMEYYGHRDGVYMFAASTYKLPLNMYYYIQENSGEISPDAVINGYELSNAHYLSIMNSDNDASEALLYGLGSYSDYKNILFQTFGDSYYSNLNNLDPIIYEENSFPSRFMLLVLQYLYNNQDSFQELLSYMSSPNQINAVDNEIREYATVYQKQGWYETANTLVEIVDSDTDYLAAIMVDDPYTYQSASILEELNMLVYEYHQEKSQYQTKLEAYQEYVEEQDGISNNALSAGPSTILNNRSWYLYFGGCFTMFLALLSNRKKKAKRKSG